MDFFGHQERARQLSRWLYLMYALAVLAVVIAIALVIGFAYQLVFSRPLGLQANLVIMATVAAAILGVSMHRIAQLNEDSGTAVAHLVGAQFVRRDSTEPAQRRLVNVVEEMAIAAGMRVPSVYLIEASTINAFAAGSSLNRASVFVTRGALQLLKRGELQGVIGHEFSHILHGDMRLNTRLLGLLAGVQWVGSAGSFLLRNSLRAEDIRAGAAAIGFGSALWLIGSVGLLAARLIQAAVSRQREFLADASSVQFTRDPSALGGALQKIGSYKLGSRLNVRYASELSHMFIADALDRMSETLFATHPRTQERLRRLGMPQFPASEAFPSQGLSVPELARNFSALVDEEMRTEANAATAVAEPPAAQRPSALADLLASVGEPSAEHVARAHALLDRVAPDLLETVQRADAAEALLYALFLPSQQTLNSQQLRQCIDARGGNLAGDAERYAAALRRLGDIARLPMLDLALPLLRVRALAERESMVRNVRALVELDRRLSLDEFVFQTIVEHDLLQRNGRPEAIRYAQVHEVRGAATLIASLLAHVAGGGSAPATAYRDAEHTHRWLGPLVERGEIKLASVKAALEDLRALAPLEKPIVIRALVAIARADANVLVRELELLRAIASAIDCPIPLLHVTQSS